LSVELREPLNARAAGVQVVESVGHGVVWEKGAVWREGSCGRTESRNIYSAV
jgi:hypothetical protein